MKNLFDRFKGFAATAQAEHAADDEGFFSTQFMERPATFRSNSGWQARALVVGAQPLPEAEGLAALNTVWAQDHFYAALDGTERQRLVEYFDFVTVPASREVIVQEEKGDYALVVLDGVAAIDRIQPTGARARLAEARGGDVLGEMSLVDSGVRYASCLTLAPCKLAVISTAALDDMAIDDPRLGMAVVASLARRLSLRTRQLSARLGALLASGDASVR